MFYENLSKICKSQKTTPTALVKELGLSTSKVTAWKNGSIPKQETLFLLAEKLGITVEYFFANTVSEHPTNAVQGNTINGNYNVVGNGSQIAVGSELTAQEQELITYFRRLSETDKAKALLYVAETLGADNP